MAESIEASRAGLSDGPVPPPDGRRRRHRWPLIAVTAGLLVVTVVLLAVRIGTPREPDRLLQRAQDEHRAGRHDRADALLDRLTALRDPTPLDRLLRAQVAMATGREEAALEQLDAIPDDHPIAPVARVLTGQLQAKLGRLPAAERAFLDALRLEPRYVQARRELAFIYSIQRRLPELDEQLEALAALGELTPSYVLHWSKIRNVTWNYEKDLDNLRRFVAGDPSDRWSRLTLAEAMRRADDPEQAERLLAPLPADDPEAAALRAAIAVDAGDLDRAEAVLAPASADHPAVARALGELSLLRGDPEAAVPPLRRAEASDPFDRRTLFALGRALTLLGRGDEAAPVLEAVRRHDRLGQLVGRASALTEANDPDLCVAIGAECLALGREAEARAWFGIALEIDPFHDDAQRALARIEAGRAAPAPDPESLAPRG